MKNIFGMIVIVLSVLFATSCSKNTDDTSRLSSTLENGNWKLTYFIYKNGDSTNAYRGYKFTFAEENMVTASGMNFYTGKWNVVKEKSRLVLNFDFSHINPIQLLNYDWTVESYNNQQVTLSWYDPYNVSTDHLVFMKW